MKKMIFVLLLVGCISLSMPAQGQITIEPTNVQLPTAAGEDFVFDLAISDPCGVSAQSFQSTISVSGPGTLTFDGTSSEALEGNADYWLFGNSAGAAALDNLDDTYTFGDGPDDGIAQALAVDDLMARYIFEWDGTPGDFVFTLVTDISSSFVQDGSFASHSLALEPGLLTPSGENGFTVYIPEPATLMLFGLGSAVLLRKRRA